MTLSLAISKASITDCRWKDVMTLIVSKNHFLKKWNVTVKYKYYGTNCCVNKANYITLRQKHILKKELCVCTLVCVCMWVYVYVCVYLYVRWGKGWRLYNQMSARSVILARSVIMLELVQM